MTPISILSLLRTRSKRAHLTSQKHARRFPLWQNQLFSSLSLSRNLSLSSTSALGLGALLWCKRDGQVEQQAPLISKRPFIVRHSFWCAFFLFIISSPLSRKAPLQPLPLPPTHHLRNFQSPPFNFPTASEVWVVILENIFGDLHVSASTKV